MYKFILITVVFCSVNVFCERNEGVKKSPGEPVSKNTLMARVLGGLDMTSRRVDCGFNSFCQDSQTCCLHQYCCNAGTGCCPNGGCCQSGTTCCGNYCCRSGQQCCGHMCCSGQCCSANSCCQRGTFCCGNGSCCPQGTQCMSGNTCRHNSSKRSFIAAVSQLTA